MAVLNRVTNAAWLLVPLTNNVLLLFFNMVPLLLQTLHTFLNRLLNATFFLYWSFARVHACACVRARACVCG